ncbi:hypothetical protein EI983_18110 [Roseovarius faecimaris]|uniref:Uncharacterized protein n=1 Tax=Roseovarius faecimaris TaxID=2494550 RepID=A0A6I6IVX5_9RHOB|nr:hypothetical protein [Roseovarius faecimaris]QGY00074.1 hypothetical protein EI983_18110 [Roseovarius faecimaris]
MQFGSAFATIAILISISTKAYAEAYESDGVATGQSNSEITEFSADHTIMNTRTVYSKFDMADATNPMSKLTGPCFGVMEMRGGAVEGNGVCVFDGLEGDRVLLGWTARRLDPQGQVHGYWTVNSGTGLWLQASGGGTFTSKVNRSNGAAKNTIKGAITLR